MRRVWIADDDDVELEFIADLLEDEPGVSAALMSGPSLAAHFDRGTVPDALLVDEEIIQPSVHHGAGLDLLPSLRLIDRIAMVSCHPNTRVSGVRRQLPGIRCVFRPLAYHPFIDAIRWLNRSSDYDAWGSATEKVAVPVVPHSELLEAMARKESEYGPHWPSSDCPTGVDEEEDDWETAGQWSAECA